MTVSVDLSSIEHWRSGLITGRICLRIGEIRFPEPEWSDFPVAILEWWLGALDGPEPVLRFMDGPYCAIVDRESKSVRLMHGDCPVATGANLEVKNLQRSVWAAARSVTDYCDRVGIGGDDIELLRRRILTSIE
jgi:hypothetical protein